MKLFADMIPDPERVRVMAERMRQYPHRDQVIYERG